MNEETIKNLIEKKAIEEELQQPPVRKVEFDEEIESYKFTIDNYDGPLDLLLSLCKEAKIDIKDIFISQITGLYLEYIRELEQIDLERATAFVAVACTLLETKSRMLLPRIEDMMPENVEEDDGAKLIRQLEEYQRFKEASEKMREIENVNSFYRMPDESVGDYRIVLKQMNLDGLLSALSRLITKVELKKQDVKPRQIKKDPFTVADKIKFVSKVIAEKSEMRFDELFGDDFTKSEIITTFQALLELMKLQIIIVSQEQIYSEISIKYNAEGAKANAEEMESTISEIIREDLQHSGEYDEYAAEHEQEFDEQDFELSIPFEDDF